MLPNEYYKLRDNFVLVYEVFENPQCAIFLNYNMIYRLLRGNERQIKNGVRKYDRERDMTK